MKTTNPKQDHDFVELLQDTYGVIYSVSGTTLSASVYEHNGKYQIYHSDIEFDTSELLTEDLPLVFIGAVFYWKVGYKLVEGNKVGASEIRIRRYPDTRADVSMREC